MDDHSVSRGDGAAAQAFVARWRGSEGGQERANYVMFINELCDLLGARRPDQSVASHHLNDYTFERVVTDRGIGGSGHQRRIDLYRRNHFLLEAKQSRWKGGSKALGEGLPGAEGWGVPQRRSHARGWDTMMIHAREQALGYTRMLPDDHDAPPFVVVCDVGECIELYADFSGRGRNYTQFPDRRGHRIYMEDLLRPEIRDRLRRVWEEPRTLDPTARHAAVTRAISERLAAVSKSLEAEGHPAEEVAGFLMRCLFSMFAEDVELLPKGAFHDLLRDCEETPENFPPLCTQLWEAMDTGGFALALRKPVRRFNGQFFKNRAALPLSREALGELRQAADHDWRDVEPAIFGALLEQALDPKERRRLGAHYTPRAFVERMVVATVIEPLRGDWNVVAGTAGRLMQKGDKEGALRALTKFHHDLCQARVLDPACGTGNFLYVAMELMKRLEGEVLETIADLGGNDVLTGLMGVTIGPERFLGMEVNPRAAAIAELVLWIGHLRWHLFSKGGQPSEPILTASGNIRTMDAVLSSTPVLARDETGRPRTRLDPDGVEVEVWEHRDPSRPEWPRAEFIVGNPPFIGGKDIRGRMGDGYVEALWKVHPKMNDSADYVMYWWDHAAGLLTAKGTMLCRFGFVTTNSITQPFQRKVVERHTRAKAPIHLTMAIPDHPWTKATPKAAAVRIAMTVAQGGRGRGRLMTVTGEWGLETDDPTLTFDTEVGTINPDLTVGTDVTETVALLANEGVCSPGVKLHGAGFIVKPAEAAHLGLGRRPGLENHIRPYRNGRDLTAKSRGVMVIDLFGLTEDEVRRRFPEVYQHLLVTVREDRQRQFDISPTKDAASYLENWWVFGKPRSELRQALSGLPRFIVTVETAKHRVFQFLDGAILPDNKLIAIGADDAYVLGVLGSAIHVHWSLSTGGRLGVGNDPVYVKSRCFDPFPFPDATEARKAVIRALAEELDAYRVGRLAEHPHLTLTGLYNVLERLRAGVAPGELSPDERLIFDDGLVMVLKTLHDRLDAAVADAYGWPVDLTEAEILHRLVALNRERAAEERAGRVRWLRPDYQAAKFGRVEDKTRQKDMEGLGAALTVEQKPAFPAGEVERTAAILTALAAAHEPLDPATLARRFRQGAKVAPKVAAVLASLSLNGYVLTDERGRYGARPW